MQCLSLRLSSKSSCAKGGEDDATTTVVRKSEGRTEKDEERATEIRPNLKKSR